MRLSIALLFLSLSLPVTVMAQDSHRDAALRFHKLFAAADATQAANITASMMASADPTLARHKQIVVKWLFDLINSAEYEDAKVRVYETVYTEGELKQLITLVQSPAYKLLQSKHPRVLELSSKPLSELARSRSDELEKRIAAAEMKDVSK